MLHTGLGTYMARHIQGVAHIGCDIYGGKVSLMHESSFNKHSVGQNLGLDILNKMQFLPKTYPILPCLNI